MPHLNDKLVLVIVTLTNQWQPLLSPIPCSDIHAQGDYNWFWASDDEGGYQQIPKDIDYHLVNGSFALNEAVCWIKGSGSLYVKCTR